MLDALDPGLAAQSPVLQRSHGTARATFSIRAGKTRLDGLHQSGCAKAMLPRTHSPAPEVVFLNTSGGVTGGDRLSYQLELGARTHVVAATQTAERAYRSPAGAGHVELSFKVGTGARLDWLPQETILFDGSQTRRSTKIDMAADSTLLWAEMLVFGRAAMGETLSQVALNDIRCVTRGGKPALLEPLSLSPSLLTAQAGVSGALAISTVAFLSPSAEDALEPVRALSFEGVRIAASAWDGKLVIRALAADALPLKRAVAGLVTTLRQGAALPRVWQV